MLLFSGYNNRAVLAFIRTLEQYAVDYAVVANDEKDPIFHTSYFHRVLHVRTSASLDLALVESCVAKAKDLFKSQSVLIAPSTEALNRFLLRHRDALAAMQVILPLPEERCYESISDKASFTRICQARGLLVPAEYSELQTATVPFVAKPKHYISGDGNAHSPVLIFDEGQRCDFSATYAPEDFYFQEYVGGRSIYLLYYFDSKGKVRRLSQENFLQQPGGKSILAARSARYHELPISREYEALFLEEGFCGLVMVELRENSTGLYMIEANPRFWGPSQLFVDAGVNFFAYLLQDYGICELNSQAVVESDTGYLWFGGMVKTLKDGDEMAFIGCSPEEFYAELDSWISYDIYKRSDSLQAFIKELG